MRVLVCNDDGFDAPGLRLLVTAARSLGEDVFVVAPERKWTAASHRVSFDCDLTLTRHAGRAYSCTGTPVDCVIAAMTVIDGGLHPDLVLAGINDKRNVGEDVAYSGTLAIAREATFWGIPAISLSRDAWPDDAARDATEVGRLLQLLWARRDQWHREGSWLGLNLPERLPAKLVQASLAHDKIAGAAEVVSTDLDRTVYRLRRGRPGHARAGDENAMISDGAVVVMRYAWDALVPLPMPTLASWNADIAGR